MQQKASRVADKKQTNGVDDLADTVDAAHRVLDATISDPSADPRLIGRILVDSGRISPQDAERIAQLQKREGLFFGEAAKKLKLLNEADVQHALAQQFNYPYLKVSEGIFREELIAAYQPFGTQAENLRAIRSQLILNWLGAESKILAIVSPGPREGRTFIAANLAVLFAQLNKRTLLIDADLRHPRQHEIFNFRCRVGLSAMLAGRIRREDLERLPEAIPFFTHLSVLGAGATPPNPLELLAGDRLPKILNELSAFYDVIIVDTPAGSNQADYQPIAACAGYAMMVTRKASTRVNDAKKVVTALEGMRVKVVGSVLNDY